MPLYDYRCAACGKVTEIRHGFNDTNAEPCPACGGELARVFNPAPIIFNGSGFYKTDSRPAKSEPSSSSSSDSSSSSSSSSSSGSSSDSAA
ncbi:MAG TPA: FmdB family zinc ribbon protein [Candidatus Acidoferrum sp.]|jgi:putative FmdB family regulatory protein|nr:FmdB family zinc ribbon protein [Candidatus Acidoferrum sp.]